ncbi:hypothetical protein [Salmonirosea aquatica]|uniref:Uncharacterized protein n=1 Tax=Salmonirosea aquatica TaxID=2654236 RepID=A0A7C9BUM3_9BACT|nr:hypothetical protein [Cytophagaceae bacterium SJW1-29]
MIRSKYTDEFSNRPILRSKIVKIKLSPPSPRNRNLWILRFYGRDEHQNEKVLGSWFYTTDRKRKDDLYGIMKLIPKDNNLSVIGPTC